MSEIKVGDKVKIHDFSGAVTSNDYGMVAVHNGKPAANDTFRVTHTDMRLPSYDAVFGQKRVNTVVLRSTRDESIVIFSRPSMLVKVELKRVAKYKVLYQVPSSGTVRISTDYYTDLREFTSQMGPLVPIHLIKETEEIFEV